MQLAALRMNWRGEEASELLDLSSDSVFIVPLLPSSVAKTLHYFVPSIPAEHEGHKVYSES